jgi:hypothetical protein
VSTMCSMSEGRVHADRMPLHLLLLQGSLMHSWHALRVGATSLSSPGGTRQRSDRTALEPSCRCGVMSSARLSNLIEHLARTPVLLTFYLGCAQAGTVVTQ